VGHRARFKSFTVTNMKHTRHRIARAITLAILTVTGFAVTIASSTVASASTQSNTQSNPAITVSDSQRFVIYTMPETAYANLQRETQNDTDIRDFTRTVLQTVPDEYDFVLIVGNDDDVPEDLYYGQYSPVKNDTAGLGKRLYDRTQEFGSNGHLQGVIHLPARAGIQGGPSLHEFTHRWANDYLPSSNGGHWGFSSVHGQLGGFDGGTLVGKGAKTYQVAPFGTFANGGNSLGYGDLELYLMGMLSAGAVAPIKVAKNPKMTDYKTGTFTADAMEEITMRQLITKHGVRKPDADRAQKTFRVLTVLATPTEPTAAQLEEVDNAIAFLSNPGPDDSSLFNFFEATRGQGKLEMDGVTLRD
jgi:hypothetical protein